MDALGAALMRLDRAFAAQEGPGALEPFVPACSGTLWGAFEVRSADGHVRRMQGVELPLPPSLCRAFACLAPRRNLSVDLGLHNLTLWAPQEIIELQVGYRWHGFSGKRMREWDERFVVFAEDGGDPLALRTDEDDGPVWLSHRGEGRHTFFEAAPDLASFYEAVAAWLETREAGRLRDALCCRFRAGAEKLWLWKEIVAGINPR